MYPSKSAMLISIVTALALVGCRPLLTEPTPRPQMPVEVHAPMPSDGSLETDRDVYTASCRGEGYAKVCKFTLVMTYTNQTDATIYFEHCGPDSTTPIYGFQELMEEESAYNAAWACTGQDRSVRVLPGEKRTDTLEVWGPNSYDGEMGKPFGVLEGRLQVSYDAYTCADEYEACALPDEVATSNLFDVRLP